MSASSQEDLRDVASDVLRHSEALVLDEVEVVVTRHRQLEVTIEKNEIHMTRVQEEPAVGVRVVHGGSLGFASTNSFAPASLAETLRNAAALARACPADAWNGLPDPRPLPDVAGLFDSEAAALSPEDALHQARRMLQAALDVDDRVRVDGGSFEATVLERAVRSTRGVRTYERETLVQANLMALAVEGGDVSGMDYWADCSRSLRGVDPAALGRDVARRVVASLHARAGRSFQGVAVLAPRAVRQLLVDPLLYAVNADNVQRGLSTLQRSVDRSIGAAVLSLADDATRRGEPASGAFDREGMPRQPRPIVEGGRLASLLHNAYTARRGGTETTGHASGGARSLPGVGATNIVVAPGQEPLADLIRGISRGVLVTRFSGHPRLMTGEFSGAIKGGFLIEKGEITHPLRETMMSGNTFDMMPRILALSRETEQYLTLTTPTILVDGVSITSRG